MFHEVARKCAANLGTKTITRNSPPTTIPVSVTILKQNTTNLSITLMHMIIIVMIQW